MTHLSPSPGSASNAPASPRMSELTTTKEVFIFLWPVSFNDTTHHTLVTSLLNKCSRNINQEEPDTEDINQLNIFVQFKLKTPLWPFQQKEKLAWRVEIKMQEKWSFYWHIQIKQYSVLTSNSFFPVVS